MGRIEILIIQVSGLADFCPEAALIIQTLTQIPKNQALLICFRDSCIQHRVFRYTVYSSICHICSSSCPDFDLAYHNSCADIKLTQKLQRTGGKVTHWSLGQFMSRCQLEFHRDYHDGSYRTPLG
ncbi:hypothetical protein CY34DRAFT_809265 [Suillus luteus UH-Slu-Lm8-n1]|uniref:Uncharacterized protein n=1 Tax=Suillus luteus UH-Slu-Lm8-n1 TaxID=930992 RepID=A0A0D0AVW2_9AGAM|nr:hypothetical protein CY34DRAFT_809265 [Suillus luteus UH-Slu-Lm8-n1]